MRKHESHNAKIDRIGERLIGRTMLSENEIDKIIASPVLYSSIRNRINATPAEAAKLAWFRVPAVAAFASILVVVGIAGFTFIGDSEKPVQADRVVPTRETAQPVTRSNEPDGFTEQLTETVAVEQARSSSPQVQNAVYRKPSANVARVKRPMVKLEPDIEFIPLVYTGDPNESVNGGRVIRVEMSRASLFAMGFNVPIDNGTELVRADLLVGQDGIPRAIRMPQ